ncbi:MAG: 3-dehydroquinate synthase [Isosphaeraceae bacterium]|nr:3-dehydroquinate synthase [Isosphaeraceae bacterium]
MSFENHPARAEVSFAPAFVHRLYFTRDLLGDDQHVLADVLEPSEGRPARVQFWVDEHVAQAQSDLRPRLRAFTAAHAGRIERAGNVQVVPGGEAVKNDIHILERILKVFHAAGLDRRSYVVVIGGGAVLDAVGFAAAIAHRGLRLVRLPTTTLAQADSGVGVKNAVNLFGKKNWLGSFAVPWAVINDAALLATLPDRDFLCGFSEAVKVALLKDPALFAALCRSAGRIRRRDLAAALPIIRASAERHRDHITLGGDPFEAREARPLDFGHWSAHRLEAMTHFHLRHGEAVAIGVAIDTVYSSLALGLPRTEAERVLQCLIDLGFTLGHPALRDTAALFEGLEEFRQHLGGRLTLTLLRGVGDPIDVHEIDEALMRRAIAYVERLGPAPTTSDGPRAESRGAVCLKSLQGA